MPTVGVFGKKKKKNGNARKKIRTHCLRSYSVIKAWRLVALKLGVNADGDDHERYTSVPGHFSPNPPCIHEHEHRSVCRVAEPPERDDVFISGVFCSPTSGISDKFILNSILI